MTYRMIAKRMSGGTEVRHVRTFKAEFESPQGAKLGAELSREEVVKIILGGKDRFYVVGDDGSEADCEVVDAKPRYVKSTPDRSKRDNLLSLPDF